MRRWSGQERGHGSRHPDLRSTHLAMNIPRTITETEFPSPSQRHAAFCRKRPARDAWQLFSAVTLCGAAFIDTSAGENLLMNGSFETPGVAGFRFTTNGAANVVTGWTAIDDGIGEPPYYQVIGRQPMSVYSGRFGVALNQGSGIYTGFSAVMGKTYELSFWFRPSTAFPENILPEPLQVRVAGFQSDHPPISAWTNARFQFTATASDPAAVLEFLNPSPAGDYRIYYLDAVSLTEVVPPALAIELSAGSFRLSWPLSASGWMLEESDSLKTWSPLPPPYSEDATSRFLIHPAGDDRRFFRLVRP